ncbi:MAG: hypothetical protein ACE5R6_20620 [Candidatus Heimdallarchaeota archaeon]
MRHRLNIKDFELSPEDPLFAQRVEAVLRLASYLEPAGFKLGQTIPSLLKDVLELILDQSVYDPPFSLLKRAYQDLAKLTPADIRGDSSGRNYHSQFLTLLRKREGRSSDNSVELLIELMARSPDPEAEPFLYDLYQADPLARRILRPILVSKHPELVAPDVVSAIILKESMDTEELEYWEGLARKLPSELIVPHLVAELTAAEHQLVAQVTTPKGFPKMIEFLVLLSLPPAANLPVNDLARWLAMGLEPPTFLDRLVPHISSSHCEAVEILLDWLKSPSIRNEKKMVEQLEHFGEHLGLVFKDNLEFCVNIARDRDLPNVLRASNIKILGQFGSTDLLSDLIDLIQDPSQIVVNAAKEALTLLKERESGKPSFPPPEITKLVVVDGNNVAWHGKSRDKGEKASVDMLQRIRVKIEKLEAQQIEIFVSSALKYDIDDPEFFNKLLQKKKLVETPAGRSDDVFLISYALKKGGLIVTNDRFKDWKAKNPELADNLEELRVPFMMTSSGDIVLDNKLERILNT